ncbi:MAG: hypothetical protein RL179_1861 [Planctomycetota bacterium]|jgi:outer membrane protein assembly factor BamB/tetratricopeptide (TPR) repeat protein
MKKWHILPFLLLVFLTSWLLGQEKAPVQAQVKVQAEQIAPGKAESDPKTPLDATDNSAVSLPRDNKMKSRIEAAQDYIKSGDWAEACNVLQKLLEIKEDVFAEISRKSADGKATTALVSVRTEANRLVASLPAKGLEFYKLTFNPSAAALLKQAKASSDPNLLAQVMKLYLHTDPGSEAALLLGTYQLDRGNFMAASLCYEKLLDRDGSEKLSPRTLFKAAYAFFQSGDLARGQKLWAMLSSRGLREINLDGSPTPLDGLKEVASKQNRAGEMGVFDWQMFAGNLKRNAQTPGGTPFMEAKWKVPTAKTNESKNALKMSENYMVMQRQQAMLPGFFPLATTITKNDEKIPLLVYRSYWGIHALQVKTGKLEWEARSDWGIDAVSQDKKKEILNQWLITYVNNNLRPGILFENTSLGCLSSDGRNVFCVEDLSVPPPPSANPYMNINGIQNNNGRAPNKEVNDAILFSKLQAYDLITGKLRWEIGERDEKSDLGDTHFLGPPVPVSGKLYVLTEKQQELRLVTLDPTTGKLLGIQTLVTTRDKLEQDVGRRTQAAHLAYGEGILVCPTNSGALLGVDLLTGSLVWAYMYRDKTESPESNDPNRPRINGMFPRRGNSGLMNPSFNNQWKVTAPVIQDGKVIFTAPDARAIHCVNLRDGTKVWTQNRQEEDLYFGGVYAGQALVIGRKTCRGIDINNGNTTWTLETGVPSGLGVASDNIYYLPIKESNSAKEPEVCAIDVARGKILAHTRSRKTEIAGNLIFHEGAVISQTTSDVAVYPQLAIKLEQIDLLIKSNPNDPLGLTERGELRLNKGDLKGAIDDLKKVLAQNITPDIKDRARAKLFEAFTDYFQQDFNAAEPFLAEYEALCKVDVRAGAEEKERLETEAEGRRRRTNFLCLVAKGRESQGRLIDAFDKYQEFAASSQSDDLISVLDEPSVRASGEVWAQGRIAAMVAKATPENKKPLEAKIQSNWEQLLKKGPTLDELKKFVGFSGSLFDVGREARLKLAERLLDDPAALLLAEQVLQPVLSESPALAGRAYEILARIYTNKNLLDDALWCYRKLGREYSDVVIRDGKKGSDLLKEANADKKFVAMLSESKMTPEARKITVTEERGNFHQQTQSYRFEEPESPLPYFQRNRLALRFDYHALKINDTLTGKEEWSMNITRTLFQNLVYGNGQPHLVRFPLQAQGHLVLLPLGHLVFAIDPVGKKILWEKNLYNPMGFLPGQAPTSPPGYNQLNVDPDGSIRILYPDGWAQRIGLSNPMTAGVAALQTRDGLVAVDPLTGKTLWTRSDINSRSILFSDGKHIFVVDMTPENNPSATRAIRAYDGVSVKVPDFSQFFAKRERIIGGKLLINETIPDGATTLRLYDIVNGKDTWKETFPAGSLVVKSDEQPGFTGVIEPDGKVKAWRIPQGTQVLSTKLDPKFITKGAAALLLADKSNFYVGFNNPVNANVMPWGGIQTNLMPGSGMRAQPVNGEFFAFERETGKLRWHNPVSHQMVVLESFQDTPMILFTSRMHKMVANGPIRNVMQIVAAKSIDKRTGKLIYDNENIPNGIQFHNLNLDLKNGKIEFVNYQLKINFRFGNDTTGVPAQEAGKKNS